MSEEPKYFNTKFYEAWWSTDSTHLPLLENTILWSYDNPKEFWDELFNLHQKMTGLPSKSIPFKTFDFYHDCIIRHLGKRRIALKMHQNSTVQEWSYELIHRLVNYQYDRWKNFSFSPGQTIAIVMPMGIHLVIALLTALRIGLKFTFLPTDSKVFSFQRILEFLKKLNPSFIVTTATESSILPDKNTHFLVDFLEERVESHIQEQFAYKADGIAQDAVTTQSYQENVLSPLCAQEMYLSAFRDGFLSLGLQPGIQWAYTSRCTLRDQPCNLIMALLCGATTIHFSDKELIANPELLEMEPIEILGLSPFLIQLWTEKKGIPKQKLKFWYKHLSDDNEKSWNVFKGKNKLEKIPNSGFFFDNSQGGILFTSPPSIDRFQEFIWPALGFPWKLLNPNHTEQKSLYPFGLFQQIPTLKSAFQFAPSNILLSQLTEGWSLSGTRSPNQEGYTIPIDVIEKGVAELEFVQYATLLTLPKSHSPFWNRLILLVFVSPLDKDLMEKEKLEWKQLIHTTIKKCAGDFFIPETIEFYPFSPKISQNRVDRNWCFFQYTTGLLANKRHHKAYYWLNLLRTTIKEGING